jgi:hypothetical protein
MKVKCKKIINVHTQQATSYWLTIDKEYVVLAVEVYPTKNYFLLVDDSDNKSPGLHDAKQFEVISHHVSSNWQINTGDLDIMTIAPKAWHDPGFWEKCYEGDLMALEIYKHEARIIMKEENAL